jgi:hypothetical protein
MDMMQKMFMRIERLIWLSWERILAIGLMGMMMCFGEDDLDGICPWAIL